MCHAAAAGMLAGPGPAAVLRLMSRGLGHAGEQTPVVGAHAGGVLRLSPGVSARVVGGPLVRLGEASTALDRGYLVRPTCSPDVSMSESGEPQASPAVSAQCTA